MKPARFEYSFFTTARLDQSGGKMVDLSGWNPIETWPQWLTRGAVANAAVGDRIERVIKWRKRYSTLGMISPVEFENRLTQTAQAA